MEELITKIQNDLKEAEKAYQFNLNSSNKNTFTREILSELSGIKMVIKNCTRSS